MMKKFFYMAVAAIAALSSCTSEDNITNDIEAPAVKTPPTFTATIEGTGTRFALGEGNKVNWEDGDEVYLIFVDESSNISISVYKATPFAADATLATLTWKSDVVGNSATAQFLFAAYYPSTLYLADFNDTFFPAVQQYGGDNKIPFAPMLYFNTDLTTMPDLIKFKNVAALLKITVPSTEMTTVKSITVSSDRAMHGRTVTPSDLYMYTPDTPTAEKCKLTLDCGEGVDIPVGGSKTFYICILPRFADIGPDIPGANYGYLKIEVTDGTTTKSMCTKKTGGIEIRHNMIYPITFEAD